MSLQKIKRVFGFSSPSKTQYDDSARNSPLNSSLPTSSRETIDEQFDHSDPADSPQEFSEVEEPFRYSSSHYQGKENIELNMIEKIQIGKKFQMNIDEISTLTTASLRADLTSLEIRLLDISPLELRTRVEPLFDLDPMLHSTNLMKNRRSLDRRISFSRPVSSSLTLSLPTHSPPIESSFELNRGSISSRSVSLDRGSKGGMTDLSPVIAKQLFPAESTDSNPPISKQEARQLQRKELSQRSETTWKSTGLRTRSVATKSIPKLSADTKSVNHHPPPPPPPEMKKRVERPSATSSSSSTSSASRAIRSSSQTSSIFQQQDSASAPQHSSALQSAAQKAVAIFTSRISKKPNSKSLAESSSQFSTGPRTPSALASQNAEKTPKRTSQTSHLARTPQHYSTSAQKTSRTPSSTTAAGLRSSMTSASSSSLASSSTSTSSSINVQRTNSGSSLSTASSAHRRGTESSLSLSGAHAPSQSQVKSTMIKATGGHHFKPKSVTVASVTTEQKPTVAPPTLRGGGGKSARTLTATSSNASDSSAQRSKGSERERERSKPTVPVSSLQSKRSFDERTRQQKAMSSSHSSAKSEEEAAPVSRPVPQVAAAPKQEKLESQEPAVNPFGALIMKTPPREE